jgi:hypothetical protein
MHVIAHQAVRQRVPPRPTNGLREEMEILKTISVVAIDVAPIDAPSKHVVHAASDLFSLGTSHQLQ